MTPKSTAAPSKKRSRTMIEVKNLPPPADLQVVRRALISVFDKSGIVDFARRLSALGIELVSTGGTAKLLAQAGLEVSDVSNLTGFPEILGGRVKTLHPIVHGGLLFRRNDPDDQREVKEHDIPSIDLVVTNLYPFADVVGRADVTMAEALENIDIGGPTMIRAAAKNHFFVGVVTSPDDYDEVAQVLETHESRLTLSVRERLAARAFERTASYDRNVAGFFDRWTAHSGDGQPAANDKSPNAAFSVTMPLAAALRYGENPHQEARLYGSPEQTYRQLHGKELSFNNLLDLNAAVQLIDEFRSAEPSVAILKHTNPCGVATRGTLLDAYNAAFATDKQSPFGGIVVVNRELDLETARAIDAVFTEIIIAPAFAADALDFLQAKKNRRLIENKSNTAGFSLPDVRTVMDCLLVQDRDGALPDAGTLRDSCTVVTKRAPTEQEWKDLDFAWRVVKNVKSNAIVYARDCATLGIGAGQMSRIDSSEIAVSKSRKSALSLDGSVVASDAFFPFADGLAAAAEVGSTAAIQPGGSVRDDEVIAYADDAGIAMVFTGRRHFRH